MRISERVLGLTQRRTRAHSLSPAALSVALRERQVSSLDVSRQRGHHMELRDRKYISIPARGWVRPD